MVNKIVKERNWYGEKTSANDIIKRFLVTEGKMFGEISTHLENEGVKYSKKGLHLRLNKLQKEGIIVKKHESGKSYPTYHLKIRSTDYSGLGWWTNYVMLDKLETSGLLSLNTKQQLRVMTTLIGVYAIFIEIQSWKLASKKKSHKEQFNIRSSFLSEALPLLTMSSVNEFKKRFYDIGFIPEMYKEKEYRNELYEYEKILEKSFPKEYKYCTEIFDMVSELGKNFPKLAD